MQFMRTRRWEALIGVCLEEGGMNNKRVGGTPWGDVCRQWWDNFAKICIHAWRISLLSGADLGRLPECSIPMGKAHVLLELPKLLWSHLWIDHMYFFARQWRTTPTPVPSSVGLEFLLKYASRGSDITRCPQGRAMTQFNEYLNLKFQKRGKGVSRN